MTNNRKHGAASIFFQFWGKISVSFVRGQKDYSGSLGVRTRNRLFAIFMPNVRLLLVDIPKKENLHNDLISKSKSKDSL
jgi:hypothetical protein